MTFCLAITVSNLVLLFSHSWSYHQLLSSRFPPVTSEVNLYSQGEPAFQTARSKSISSKFIVRTHKHLTNCSTWTTYVVCRNRTYTHCVSKKRPTFTTCYNFYIHSSIATIFGINVAEKVGNQSMLYFSTTPN